MPDQSSEEVAHDLLDTDRVKALAGLLDQDDADLRPSARLPLMWHVAFFLPRPAQSGIGPDGHPLIGFPTPPAPGLRRMFAGGRVELRPGLVIGASASARTTVVAAKEREGRAGKMHFRTTRAEVTVAGQSVLTDERDIVYLESAPVPVADPAQDLTHLIPDEVEEADAARTVKVDPTLLFRFSALTYNSHRIHYDRDYARTVEGHPGLVVHGPLQAVLMAQTGSRLLPAEPRASVRMEYRLVAPLYEHQGLHVVAQQSTSETVEVKVLDGSGRESARANISTCEDPR